MMRTELKTVGLLVAGLLVSSSAQAATYYVATAGNDSSPGTLSAPFKTIKKGTTVLVAGDTLQILPGTYTDSFSGGIPSGSSWSAPVTLKAYDPNNRPVLKPTGAQRVFLFQGQSYIVLDGLVIDGAGVSVDAVKITDGGGLPAAHHIRIKNSEIRNAPGQGVLTTDAANNNEFINDDIHDNGTNELTHGIYISTSNNLIDSCRIYRNSGWGVHVYAGGPGIANANIVRNNDIHDNARVGGRGNGIALTSGVGNVAYNNVVRGNHDGIWVEYDAQNTGVYNNTVYANWGEFGIYLGPGSTSATVRNNIVYKNTANSIVNSGASSVVSNNLIGPDPKFVGEATFDFHLQSSSPAIDQGVAVSGITTDFSGAVRPSGANFDIGAFEYVAPVTTSQAPRAPTNVRVIN